MTGRGYGGAGTAQADNTNAGVGTGMMPPAGTNATIPQSQYSNQYPAGATDVQSAGGPALNAGANRSTNAPPLQQGGPPPDYTATGSGTGVPPGGPQTLP